LCAAAGSCDEAKDLTTGRSWGPSKQICLELQTTSFFMGLYMADMVKQNRTTWNSKQAVLLMVFMVVSTG